MNEIAQLCEKLGADVDMVRRGIGSDDRIGKRFCFRALVMAEVVFQKMCRHLIRSAEEVKYDFKILKAVEEVNEAQKLHLGSQDQNHILIMICRKAICFVGTGFKPNTDDIREAPALYLIDALTAAGATIKAFDPEAMPNVKKQLIAIRSIYAENQYKALWRSADALIIATEWSEFRTPDFEMINSIAQEQSNL